MVVRFVSVADGGALFFDFWILEVSSSLLALEPLEHEIMGLEAAFQLDNKEDFYRLVRIEGTKNPRVDGLSSVFSCCFCINI